MLLWAIVAGAFIKFVLNEGVARWQVATGETLLEGACHRFGPVVRIVFLLYLLPWTFAVGASVMSACAGVASAALAGEAGWGATGESGASGGSGGSGASASMKVVLGLGHSLVAAGLVLSGGYVAFKRVTGVLTVMMVLLVVVAAVMTGPDVGAVAGAIFVPRLPVEDAEGVQWTLALFGGVGGTVTMLAYGYWMREEGGASGGTRPARRAGGYRIDLGIAYTVTAIFGVALTILSSDVPVHSSGSNLFQAVAARLAATAGPIAGWAYLAGVWCAVWACMLGTWQFVPLLFADFISTSRVGRGAGVAGAAGVAGVARALPETPAATGALSRTLGYRAYLVGMATVPALGVWLDFAVIQRGFGILGSMFIPLLALALLLMNNRRAWVGGHTNGFLSNAALVAALVVTTVGLVMECARLLGR